MFIKTCLFNDLIYNTDAHGKNFSIYIVRQGYALTPMYDLLSAHFISAQNQERYDSMRGSLSVNGKVKFNEIKKEDWFKECKKCNFSEESFKEIILEMKNEIEKLGDFQEKIKAQVDVGHLDLIIEGIRRRWETLKMI